MRLPDGQEFIGRVVAVSERKIATGGASFSRSKRPAEEGDVGAATWTRRTPWAGMAFVVLAVTGNALQGSTPALHGDSGAVAEFYTEKATAIAVGMMLSLVSVFFLAWFLGSLRRHLAASEGPEGWITAVASGGGVATVGLLAAGFALNSAGALRARETGITRDVAAVFYDSSLALTGLAASLTMAVLLAATALVTLRSGTLPRWFGWTSAVLAVLGIVTPVSFVLSLLFPVWVAVAAILLARPGAAGRTGPAGDVPG